MSEKLQTRKEAAEEKKAKRQVLIGKIKKLSDEGLTNAEIAEKTKVSEATVRVYKAKYIDGCGRYPWGK